LLRPQGTGCRIDTKEFEGASLVGDYSRYASSVGVEMSSLLDFITSDLQAVYGPSKQNITPQEIEAIINDKARAKELADYADLKLDEAIDKGMKFVKRTSLKGSNICVLDFDDVRLEDSKYPLPGRFASKLIAKMGEMGVKRIILLVSAGAYILTRIDSGLCSDLDFIGIVEEMRRRYPDDIVDGGGHRCAGGMKLRDKKMSKEMLGSLVNIIKSEIG
jgi:RecJ-like exonuclease